MYGGLLGMGVLTAALTVDSFAAGVGLGAQGIRIPPLSAASAAGVGAVWMAVGLWTGQSAGRLFSVQTARAGAAVLLFIMGSFKLFEGALKMLLRRHGQRGRMHFSAFGLRFLLEVYLDPERADANQSKTLGGFEAAGLGLVLSVDNLAAGISAGMEGTPAVPLLILVMVMGTAMLFLGSSTACRAARKGKRDYSMLGGVILILLAVFRI